MQRQVVSNGVLEERKEEKKRKAGWGPDKQRDLCLPFSLKHYRSALAYECKSIRTGGSLLKTHLAWQLTYTGERSGFKVTRQTNAICNSKKHVHKHAHQYYSVSNTSWTEQGLNCRLSYLQTYSTCGPLFPSQKHGPIVKHHYTNTHVPPDYVCLNQLRIKGRKYTNLSYLQTYYKCVLMLLSDTPSGKTNFWAGS